MLSISNFPTIDFIYWHSSVISSSLGYRSYDISQWGCNCTLLYHYFILWGMGRTGTGMAIHPTLPSFDLSPTALLQLATKSQADLKKNIINFYKCISLLSVPCFQLCHRNDNLQASSASIFFVLLKGDSYDVRYLPPTSWVHGPGVLRLSSSLNLLQPQGRNGPWPQDPWGKASSWQRKQEERGREKNVDSNGKLCLWSVENMQSSDLPSEAASEWVLFNDLLFPAVLLPAH